MLEFAQTRNGLRFLADVHRIAAALERLATNQQRLVESQDRLTKAIEDRSTSVKANPGTGEET